MTLIKFIGCTIALFLFVAPLTTSRAQDKPAIELKSYYLILYLQSDGQRAINKNINAQHIAYMDSLAAAGMAVTVGNILDEAEIRGIVIVDEESKGKVQELANADPAVKSGELKANIITLLAGRNMLANAKVET